MSEIPPPAKDNCLYIDSQNGDVYVSGSSKWNFFGSIRPDPSQIESRSYSYTQVVPANLWTVTHNLNKYPSVSISDSAGNEIFGDVKYTSLNDITISFTCEITGTAYLI